MLERTESEVDPRYRYYEREESNCKCQRRTRSHGMARHGKFGKNSWEISLTSESKNHLNDNCFHSAWQASSWIVRFRLVYCGRLLSGALQASLACTGGAGGASFTPSIDFRNVASRNSPAFAIVSKIELWHLDRGIEEQILDLRKLFQERRASPYNTEMYGNTLLHLSKLATLLENETLWHCRRN